MSHNTKKTSLITPNLVKKLKSNFKGFDTKHNFLSTEELTEFLNLLENYELSDPEIENFENNCSKNIPLSLTGFLEIENPEFSKSKIFKIICKYLSCDRNLKHAFEGHLFYLFSLSNLIHHYTEKGELQEITFLLIKEKSLIILNS
jgi:hypothetical protein